MDNWKLLWLTLITHNNVDVGPQFVGGILIDSSNAHFVVKYGNQKALLWVWSWLLIQFVTDIYDLSNEVKDWGGCA